MKTAISMNKILLAIYLIFFPGASLLAQFSMDSLYKRPHVTIDGQQVDALSLLLLDQAQIATLEVVSPENEVGVGREDLEFGTVEVTLKDGAKLLNLPELLKLYQLKATVVQLPVVVAFGFSSDKLFPKDQQILAFSERKVRSVVIERRFGQLLPQFSVTKRQDYHNDSKTPIGLQLDSLNHLFQEEARKRNPADTGVTFGRKETNLEY